MGAWIEMPYDCDRYAQLTSLLSWERGLKSLSSADYKDGKLSLLSWERGLKLDEASAQLNSRNVAPLVGAWIEITLR